MLLLMHFGSTKCAVKGNCRGIWCDYCREDRLRGPKNSHHRTLTFTLAKRLAMNDATTIPVVGMNKTISIALPSRFQGLEIST